MYATWHEVFRQVDTEKTLGTNTIYTPRGYLDVEVPDGDYRISRGEWLNGLPAVREAAASWAPYLALQRACEDDFDTIDQNGGGYVDFQEFCEWIEQAEKRAGTEAGIELGVNEPVDQPAYEPRQWHTAPLEVHPARHKGDVPPAKLPTTLPREQTPPPPPEVPLASPEVRLASPEVRLASPEVSFADDLKPAAAAPTMRAATVTSGDGAVAAAATPAAPTGRDSLLSSPPDFHTRQLTGETARRSSQIDENRRLRAELAELRMNAELKLLRPTGGRGSSTASGRAGGKRDLGGGSTAEASASHPAVEPPPPSAHSTARYPSARYARRNGRGESIASYQKRNPPYPYVTDATSHAAFAAYHLASVSAHHGGHRSLKRPSSAPHGVSSTSELTMLLTAPPPPPRTPSRAVPVGAATAAYEGARAKVAEDKWSLVARPRSTNRRPASLSAVLLYPPPRPV